MIIYDSYGNILLETEVSDRSGLYSSLDNRNQLTLHFCLDRLVDIPVGSWCNFEGNRYELMSAADVKMNHTENYEYSVVFSSDYSLASRYKVRNMVDGRLKFDLVAKPHEHLQMIVDNLNARDGGWSIGSCVESVEKLVSYNHTNCEEALVAIAGVFETEIEAIGKVLSLKKVEYFKDSPLALSYGKGNGFRPGIQRTNVADGLPVERLFIQGGSRNISLKEYGASELHLPAGLSFGFDGKLFEWEEGYDASNGRLFVTDDEGMSVMLSDRSAGKEDSLDLSEVYPKREGEVTGVVFLFKGKEYDVPSSSWTEDDWNEVQIDIIDSTIPESLDFNDCLLENNEPLTVVFQSGMLAGREFNATYISDKKRFELEKQEFDGQPMPQDAFSPKVGDSYGVFNVYLPASYVSDATTHSGAEYDALREASKYLYEKSVVEFSFTGEIDGMWAKKNWNELRPRIRIGSYVSFTHNEMFPDKPAIVRMVGITQYVNNPHYPKIELSNSVGVSTVSSRLNQIENNEAHVVELHEDAKRYTKRRYADIKQTIRMLSEALDNYTEGISPITVETMLAAVGDESLQYVFTRTIDSDDPASLEYSYNPEDGVFTVSEAFIKHMTLGIDSISPVHSEDEYLRWQVAGLASESLDKESGYYLYAKVSKESMQGEFVLSDHALKIDSDEGYYNLLVGILNAEFEGERSFASMYGFTEILPGQITTDTIKSADGKTWLDLLRGILHLNDNAGVSGAIDAEKGDKSIAAWFGGLMEDLEFDYNPSNPANTLFRHDGSGYLAKGNIKFNEKGEVELSPNIRISGTGNETLDSILTMLAVLNDMFYFADDETIGTKYNFFSEKENSAGGVGEATGTTGGGIDPDELEDILNEKGYATEGYVEEEIGKVKADIKAKPSSYVPLKTINGLSLYGSGNINVEGSGGGSEGLTAINVNDESFQPDENGIVTLPDYPSALPNPKTLTFGSKTYDGSAARTITETDVISDINTIRTKLGNLENYDDSEVRADIATLEGYFTNGKANNADKLDGQDSTYFATAQSVSSLTSTVTSVTNDVSALKPRVASNEGDIATLKGKMGDAESKIATQGNDIVSLKNSMLKAEEDIADNADGIKDNAEDITDLDRRLDSIESWYNNVGSKFSKDTDGTIKMEGDFYTTGENSAGGAGESVGGSGGGIDTEELDSILDKKGYATEDWVNEQGFAKGTIPTMVSQLTNDKGYVTASAIPSVPTRVSQLENDANYLASITGEMVRSALTYTPFNSDNFTKLNIKNTLGISDWALASSKPTYSYGEIANTPDMSGYVTTGTFNAALAGKVDAVSGKGLSTNDYTTAEKNKVASIGSLGFKDSLAFSELTDKPTTLEGYGVTDDVILASNIGEHTAGKAKQLATPRKIWGQDFDGTEDITGKATFASGIIVGGGEEILGIMPEGGSYPRMRIFMHTSGLYFQTSTYDGTSQNGNMQFSGMYGANAAEIHFKGDYTQFHGIAKIDGDIVGGGYGRFTKAITTYEELGILTADSQNYCARLVPIVDGAQLQVGWQDGSSNNGNFYFTGMYGAALNLFNVRSNHSYFDGETVVFRNTGLTQFNAASTFNGGAKIASGQPLSFLDSNGAEHKITYDEASQAFKIDGDLFTTGETSAGGKGSESFDLASVLDRLAALEDNAAKNLAVDFSLLSSNIGDGKLQTVMNRIGFTDDAVNGLLDAKYNKVVGNGTYREVWNYTAHETASYIEIYLRKGDGNLVGEWYNLYYNKTTQKWNIMFGEI